MRVLTPDKPPLAGDRASPCGAGGVRAGGHGQGDAGYWPGAATVGQ